MNYSFKYKVASAALAVSLLVGGAGTFSSSSKIYAAEVTASSQAATIIWGVNLRADSSPYSKAVRMLSKGERVTIVGVAANGWYQIVDSYGNSGYISNDAKYTQISGNRNDSNSSSNINTEKNNSDSSSSDSINQTAKTGTIASTVNFRKGPGSSYAKIRSLSKGEKVSIISETSGWYKITDKNGVTGYVSSSSQYISVTGSNTNNGSNPNNGSNGSGDNNSNQGGNTPVASAAVEKVISAGMKYLGTPYEFGSNRNSTRTFDCSAFVRQAFKDALGVTLPGDSRSQGAYVKNKGKTVTSINNLKRGDLMFFMSYKGSGASSYSGINKNNQTITHVGIYLGDGKILHTYSKESGGVKTNSIKGTHWEYRFLFGGSAL